MHPCGVPVLRVHSNGECVSGIELQEDVSASKNISLVNLVFLDSSWRKTSCVTSRTIRRLGKQQLVCYCTVGCGSNDIHHAFKYYLGSRLLQSDTIAQRIFFQK